MQPFLFKLLALAVMVAGLVGYFERTKLESARQVEARLRAAEERARIAAELAASMNAAEQLARQREAAINSAEHRVRRPADGGALLPTDWDYFEDYDRIVPYVREKHWDDSPFQEKRR